MFECIVIYRSQNTVIFVRDPDDMQEIAIFPNKDAAVGYCEETPIFKSGRVPYQIVELDEL